MSLCVLTSFSFLQRIAEGNPDPDRIGAFGVGFYSLFSIAEEPIVSSGSELMGFFWNGDSLFTRRAASTSVDVSPSGAPWTTFHMPLREAAPFPDSFLDLSRFLATSLTFTANVKQLGLFFDDKPLCQLNKRLDPAKALPMPTHLNATSPARMLRVSEMSSTAMQLDVQVMQLVLDLAQKPKKTVVDLASAFTKSGGGGFASMLQSAFGRAKDRPPQTPSPAPIEESATPKAGLPLDIVSSSVHVRIASASAKVSVDRAFEREIERSTKKPPPKVTKLHVIVQNKDEADASQNSHAGQEQLFQGIMPNVHSQGHVFIGFKTSQTTAFAGHLAARFIPTVERESIDFIDRYCAQWNNELLAMGGYVTRAVYEAEMADIATLWSQKLGKDRPKQDDPTAKWLLDRALHLMQFFTFRASTPSSKVYSVLETAFFQCARQATLTLASTRGIKNSALVRFPNAVLADFVKDLAVIPPAHVEQASQFISQVKSRGLVKEIMMEDVFSELASRPLPVEEMVACLRWWIGVSNYQDYDPSLRRQLLDNALLEIPAKDEGGSASIQQLAAVTATLNPQRIPTDVVLPSSCLSYEVSKELRSSDLFRVFGWSELTMSQWVTYVVGLSNTKDVAVDSSIQLSPTFAEKVLGILARSWGSLSVQQQNAVVEALKDVPCIPTRRGIHKPTEAYFSNVSLFEDLPIIELPTVQVKGNLEKVAASLGVRRHVELQMIFNRLVGSGDWDIPQLVSYLAANKSTLSQLEMDRLLKTAMFPKAGEVGPPGKDGKPKVIRYRANQLYEPVDALKALNLPVLDWPGKPWRPQSDEAKFTYDLGLLRHPPMEELLSLASSRNTDESTRQKALAFFLERHSTVYKGKYSLQAASSFAFVPSEVDGEKRLMKPSEVFTNKDASVMGFPIISASVSLMDVSKLGLQSNPNSAQILSKLINQPTKDPILARKIFEYLSTVPTLGPSDYKLLQTAPIIPVKTTSASSADKNDAKYDIRLIRPVEAYFGDKSTDSQLKDVLHEVFTFIDFGDRAAVFLRNCGVSNEPTIVEVALQLVRSPQKFFRIAGVDNYLGLLRQIASNWHQMPNSLRNEMKRSSFMLTSKRVNVSSPLKTANGNSAVLDEHSEDEDAEEQGVLVHDLKRPDESVIVDDATSHMLFAAEVFSVPHEDAIEAMAADLGARKLSSLVEERYEAAGQVLRDTRLCREVAATVLERTPLFIFEKRQTGKGEIRRDAEWLKANLEVVQVDGRGLRLTRELRYGKVHVSNEQRCSAMASPGQSGRLLLYIAGNMDIDWFEVALALSKYLLHRQRLPEILLYMTLLSTSLRNLKRRGFHVDKILSQRKADREAAERHQREERARMEMEAAQRPSESQFSQWTKDMQAVFPDADADFVRQLLQSFSSDHVVQATNAMLERPYPRSKPAQGPSKALTQATKQGTNDSLSSSAHTTKQEKNDSLSTPSIPGMPGPGNGFLTNLRSRLKGGQSSAGPPVPGGWQPGLTKYPITPPTPMHSGTDGQFAESIAGSVAGVNTSTQATARNPQNGVTPTSSIRNKVLSAIQASRGSAHGADPHIQSSAAETKVKEAQSTYCDATGMAQNLRLAGNVSGMEVYVSPELDPNTTLTNNADAMQSFVEDIIRPCIGVFNVDPKGVHVFVDVSGPSIAFNRGGQLFLNFRYHLVWFDDQVRKQHIRTNALISTYHSLAHELAHNLVTQHDSEHEFWFSSICEQYFVPFAALVTRVQQEDETHAGRDHEPRLVEV